MKDMFRCPHCKKVAISCLSKSKAVLSPGFPAVCSLCNGSSAIGYKSWLIAMLPGSFLMIVAIFVDSETGEWLLNITGMLLMVTVSFLFTPLHKEDQPDSANK